MLFLCKKAKKFKNVLQAEEKKIKNRQINSG